MSGLMMLASVGVIEVVVGGLAAGLVVFTIVFNVIRRKKGKSSCGCDCSGCKSGCCPTPKDNGQSK